MAERKLSNDYQQVYLEALSRFDHFMTGGIFAACAYLATTNPYAKLGLNLPTLYLTSLLVLALSAFCALKRLEQVVQTLRHNTLLLERTESHAPRRDTETARELTHAASRSSHIYYVARNALLTASFLLYLAAKVLEPYLAAP